ncbi:peptidoglycan DD-metalloendopeptidase family protein [Flavobacterium taihuense]|uniref:Peptidoglycan DD-metalloendopeptidase family protein n=1 Tax=Flavobacterium taihuense TaxID=2857508 RepID=A0ABS6Y2H2_9FLAO|nr:peptidoglycan DD-metalloendopeptidase family protein [Flavobacterium taihuense]MBW4362283.1 peptidoglycan DD-metalloendopeptidase family protein [Flavobacterium taihuense]
MTPLETLFSDLKNIKVIDSSIPYSKYVSLDLSASNLELNQLNISDATEFEKYIEQLLAKNKASVAYGGYNEIRNLYKRSTAFNNSDTDERNIHIGLDLWIRAGTPVLSALDGKVHSFQYNNNLGDYGPTIILEHQLEEHVFYTLYGHLALESIAGLKAGDFFAKGQQLASLGEPTVNGDYAPHLHFQIIKNIEHYYGDYPGVCSNNKLPYYLQNCPDPNLLLKIY